MSDSVLYIMLVFGVGLIIGSILGKLLAEFIYFTRYEKD